MDTVIQTSLMVLTAFSLLLRETERLMTSVLLFMDLTISSYDRIWVTS